MEIKLAHNRQVIVFYDGVCLFCEGWVKFVIKHLDRQNDVFFIPLQYYEITETPIKYAGGDSIVLIENDGSVWYKSDASLRTLFNLHRPWNYLAYLLYCVPRPIRNFVYDFVGKNRYKIWGKKDYCEMPDASIRTFILQDIDDLPDALRVKVEKFVNRK